MRMTRTMIRTPDPDDPRTIDVRTAHDVGPLVVGFAERHGPELTDWQRDVVELAYAVDERPAQRPHKRRRRPLVGVSVRWGRCVAYGGVGGVLVGLLVGLR